MRYKESKQLRMSLYDLFLEQALDCELNYELTISFTNQSMIGNKNPFRLTQKDLPDGERLIKAYLGYMDRHVNHGMQHDAIAIPEFKTSSGEDSILHYHCLISVDKSNFMRFWRFTSKFMSEKGNKHFGSPFDYHLAEIANIEAYITYSLKTIDGDYPIDRIILWGEMDEGRVQPEHLPAGATWSAAKVTNFNLLISSPSANTQIESAT